MTRWFWRQVGGTLVEEFMVVSPMKGRRGGRWLDGLIVTSMPTQLLPARSDLSIEGHDVIVVQTKNSRLGMYLMGQALFSSELIKRMAPRSVRSVALCQTSDELLQPMLEAHAGCEVCVAPAEICARAELDGPSMSNREA